jgi:hypothetical protein
MRWISHSTKRHTQNQLQELRRETLSTLNQLSKAYPHEEKSKEILRAHRLRVAVLVRQGGMPSPLRPDTFLPPLLGLTGTGLTLLVLFLQYGADGVAQLFLDTLSALF